MPGAEKDLAFETIGRRLTTSGPNFLWAIAFAPMAGPGCVSRWLPTKSKKWEGIRKKFGSGNAQHQTSNTE
jgi:hypothetical protein